MTHPRNLAAKVLGALAAAGLLLAPGTSPATPAPVPEVAGKATKLYWFIPDGLRADPDLFTVFRWAREGKLPNIKRMMDEGAFGYSIPDFPSHTPTNFASLVTGAHPSVHGIADGPMHIEGAPLARPSVAGFASNAKKVAPIWKVLEQAGKKVALLAIPGSTPPELDHGITVRGRWGGWGADTPAVNYEPMEKLAERKEAGKAFKLFFLGQKLTEFVETGTANGWEGVPAGFSPARETTLAAYGLSLHAHISDTTDDGKVNYDTIRFSLNKKNALWTLKQGAWSDWRQATLTWKDLPFPSQVRVKVIRLWPEDGSFRIRLFFNNANRLNSQPAEVAEQLTAGVGPMVDFVDNWPAQLVYEDEDKATFLEEARDSLAWHKRAAGFVLRDLKPDVLIQDTYTPNQMLEARWWHRYIDREHPDYDSGKEASAWADILEMYQGIDAILGEAMAAADKNTLVVLSSDHGVIPLRKQVCLNNLFARKGWLNFTIDEATGEPAIDWARTRVVYLKMAHVYVDPAGLAGNWSRASGPEYEKLRDEVVAAIAGLVDEDGTRPLVRAVTWEEVTEVFGLPVDRSGDIVLEVTPGYQWWEELNRGKSIFARSLASGYKQAVDARTTKGMWTPFVIMGPGVRKGVRLEEPISHVDQMPTLLKLLNVPIPAYVQGRPIDRILE